jgi:hypothetical protein
MTTTIQFSSPKLIRAELKNNKLHLILDWGDETGTSIISRNQNGYNYEDIESKYKRHFESGEFMIWEYNLPISVDILELLPILNESNRKFQQSKKMIEDVNELISKLKAS